MTTTSTPDPKQSSDKPRIRAAVIGVGYLGAFHAEKYANSPDTDLVAVVDVDGKRAEQIASRFGAKALTSIEELPSLGIDCASVATTTSTHYPVASWLMEHGIDVLIEKPVATSTDEAENLIRIAKARGRILQVGHLERFNPAFRAVEQILQRPRFFEVRRIAAFTGRSSDVDVVLDLMIHDIDLVSHLVRRPLVRVDAVGVSVLTPTTDIANARLTFAGGAVANVTASRAAFKTERTLRIFQPDTYVSLDLGNKKLKIYRKFPPAEGQTMPQISVTEQEIENRDALNDEVRAFLEAVRNRTAPIVSGEDGLRALLLAEQIKAAFRESERAFMEGFELPLDASPFGH